MAAGEIFDNQGLVTVALKMKVNTDASAGKLYTDDGSGNGMVGATAALAATQKVFMALEDHDYSEKTDHKIGFVAQGFVRVAKKTGAGSGFKANARVAMSSDAGEVAKFVMGDVTATVNEATVEAANLVNVASVGYAVADAGDSDATVDMWLGKA